MILTVPVLLYQLVFVVALYVASLFGKYPLLLVAGFCLLWTATHVFFPPLMVLQASVIVVTTLVLLRRLARRRTREVTRPE